MTLATCTGAVYDEPRARAAAGNGEGGCPVYRVVNFEDVDVILQGRARVRKVGGVSRTLMHHAGCVGDISDKLSVLKAGIDEAVGSARWMKERR
jgi:hypothetical protein